MLTSIETFETFLAMEQKKEIPSPEMLLVEATGAVERDAPLDLNKYAAVIGELRQKNYSFGKIADWFTERIGRPINKGGVFRAFQNWKADLEYDGPSPEDCLSDSAMQADDFIDEIAESVLATADDVAASKSLPTSMIHEGLLRAVKNFEQAQADEKAAETADAAGPSNQTQEKE